MPKATLTQDHNRITLSGSLSVTTVRQLFVQTPQFGAERVNIDLASVQEVDSTGLALLVHWVNVARASSNKLSFTGVPAQLQALAKIAGMEQLFAE